MRDDYGSVSKLIMGELSLHLGFANLIVCSLKAVLSCSLAILSSSIRLIETHLCIALCLKQTLLRHSSRGCSKAIRILVTESSRLLLKAKLVILGTLLEILGANY